MKIIDWVHVVAGTLVMIGVILMLTVSPWWAILPLFVGANLFQFGFTGFCPLILILKQFGMTCELSRMDLRLL